MWICCKEGKGTTQHLSALARKGSKEARLEGNLHHRLLPMQMFRTPCGRRWCSHLTDKQEKTHQTYEPRREGGKRRAERTVDLSRLKGVCPWRGRFLPVALEGKGVFCVFRLDHAVCRETGRPKEKHESKDQRWSTERSRRKGPLVS
jgi:hypothetical protein